VCLWDVSVTHPRREGITWPDHFSNWSFAPDGRSVFTLDSEGKVTRWGGTDYHEKESWLSIWL
jgi:hypothetical protein